MTAQEMRKKGALTAKKIKHKQIPFTKISSKFHIPILISL